MTSVPLDGQKLTSLSRQALSFLGPINYSGGISIEFKLLGNRESGMECNIEVGMNIVIHGARQVKTITPKQLWAIYGSLEAKEREKLRITLLNLLNKISFTTKDSIEIQGRNSGSTFILPSYAANVNSFSWALKPTDKNFSSTSRLALDLEFVLGDLTAPHVKEWVEIIGLFVK